MWCGVVCGVCGVRGPVQRSSAQRRARAASSGVSVRSVCLLGQWKRRVSLPKDAAPWLWAPDWPTDALTFSNTRYEVRTAPRRYSFIVHRAHCAGVDVVVQGNPTSIALPFPAGGRGSGTVHDTYA